MTYLDLAGLVSAAVVLMAIGGAIAERIAEAARNDPYRQAHRR